MKTILNITTLSLMVAFLVGISILPNYLYTPKNRSLASVNKEDPNLTEPIVQYVGEQHQYVVDPEDFKSYSSTIHFCGEDGVYPNTKRWPDFGYCNEERTKMTIIFERKIKDHMKYYEVKLKNGVYRKEVTGLTCTFKVSGCDLTIIKE